MKLLTLGNPKATKSIDYGYLTGILHLLPHTLSGHNVCPQASPGCSASCLNLTGRGGLTSAQAARRRRTLLYFNNPEAFYTHLTSDVYTLMDEALRRGLKPAVRCNGTSDMPRVAMYMAAKFPDVQFYDYTKIKAHALRRDRPANLYLTFSRSETNEADCLDVLKSGVNVSVIFGDRFPDEWNGYRVIDGDKHDLRFLDPTPVVVGLTPKGKLAKQDTTGFVVR